MNNYYKKIYLVIMSLFNFYQQSYALIDLKKLHQEQYQDIIINGKVYKKGVRDCQKRYDAIKKILDQYKRPITILDLGASQGYFSFKIAQDYDSTCVMVEGNYDDSWNIADQLEDLCKLNSNLGNILFLKKRITIDELQKLGECEHFDVVLAFNVIHHFDSDWQKATDAILNLGDNVIIETPPPDDDIKSIKPHIKNIDKYLQQKEGELIAEIPRHTSQGLGKMYWFPQQKKRLTKKYWLSPSTTNSLYITSDLEKKYLYHGEKKQLYDWKKGINLCTFYALGGTYPDDAHIKKEILRCSKIPSTDFTLYNFIIQGKKIVPIDTNDTRYVPHDQKKCTEELIDLFSNKQDRQINMNAYKKRYFG